MSITTDSSEILDTNEEIHDLLAKNKQLSVENDQLKKTLKERDLELTSQLQQFKITNEKLLKTNKSLEKLNNSYGCIGDTTGKSEKYLDLEQNELKLQRQVQSLNREIYDLKIQIEFMKIASSQKNKQDIKLLSDYEELFETKKMEDEKRTLLMEILTDYEEVKRKNIELEEKALNIISEKELANIELREKLEKTKNSTNNEINKLLQEVKNLKENCNNQEKINEDKYESEDNLALTLSEQKELVDNLQKLEDENNAMKKQVEILETKIEKDRSKYQGMIVSVESQYKRIIKDLEDHNRRLNSEINNYETEKSQMLKEISNDSESKNILFLELEKTQISLRNLEETKEKNESNYKMHIFQLNEDILEYDRQLQILREAKTLFEKEITDINLQNNKKLNELTEKHKDDIKTKEREFSVLKNVISLLEKEKNELRSELEMAKVNSEKSRGEYLELVEKIRIIKEEQDVSKQKFEDRLLFYEKSLENEKNKFNLEILSHQSKIKDLENRLQEKNQGSTEDENEEVVEVQELKKPDVSKLRKRNSLCDVLDSSNDQQNFGQCIVIIQLQNEIKVLEQKLIDLNAILLSKNHNALEIDILKKENCKLKQDIKDSSELYESQINKLQDQIKALNEVCRNNSSESVGKTLAENKFLTEKIDILQNELSQLNSLYDKEKQCLKKELLRAEQETVNAKVELASIAFERDSEIINLKNLLRKFNRRTSVSLYEINK